MVTTAAAQPYGELGLTDYEPMRISCSLSWYAAVLGIDVPTVMYVLAALLSVRRLLRQNTVLLLNGSGDEGRRKLRRGSLPGESCLSALNLLSAHWSEVRREALSFFWELFWAALSC